MKQILLAAAVALTAFAASAQEKKETPWQLVDARELRIINKGWDNTARDYTRIPAYLKDSVRPDLWERSQCASGIAVRFATDSRRVGAKYRLLWDTHLPHMADTGLKGTDLYIFEGDSVWRHVNTNRPKANNKETKINETTYVSNLDGGMHEYMIYLPLYDGIEEFYVKVDSGATITPGRADLIDRDLKIVAYGTSILQGGCASRTGMAATNMLSRELNCEVVNIGISGEGKMDACMARAMAQIADADLFLLDPVPNCTEMMCDTLTYDFVRILRDARPDVPVVMLEGPIYPYARYDSYFGNYLPRKNAAFRRNYERLKAERPDNLYYVTSEGLDGVEDDGTVDGIHLTDLGFRHYADKLRPILEEILADKIRLPARK
ncbi:MAG: SGNH/GDSL hydrolase family protein [Muribaculaceae bacterium]|nr:SGNH/GDSL hydrolase family protein [Muribaculaceae bacterium]